MKFTIYNLQFTKGHQEGISLLEILVVVTIFAVLGIITTRAVLLTIQGSKKSESLVKVRENLDYSMGVVERNLRNANSVTECPLTDPKIINYIDQSGSSSSFSCINIGSTDSYIASGSARLTSDAVEITVCSFSCNPGTSANPPVVNVTLEAKDANAVGVQGATVSTSTQIYLRSY